MKKQECGADDIRSIMDLSDSTPVFDLLVISMAYTSIMMSFASMKNSSQSPCLKVESADL